MPQGKQLFALVILSFLTANCFAPKDDGKESTPLQQQQPTIGAKDADKKTVTMPTEKPVTQADSTVPPSSIPPTGREASLGASKGQSENGSLADDDGDSGSDASNDSGSNDGMIVFRSRETQSTNEEQEETGSGESSEVASKPSVQPNGSHTTLDKGTNPAETTGGLRAGGNHSLPNSEVADPKDTPTPPAASAENEHSGDVAPLEGGNRGPDAQSAADGAAPATSQAPSGSSAVPANTSSQQSPNLINQTLTTHFAGKDSKEVLQVLEAANFDNESCSVSVDGSKKVVDVTIEDSARRQLEALLQADTKLKAKFEEDAALQNALKALPASPKHSLPKRVWDSAVRNPIKATLGISVATVALLTLIFSVPEIVARFKVWKAENPNKSIWEFIKSLFKKGEPAATVAQDDLKDLSP